MKGNFEIEIATKFIFDEKAEEKVGDELNKQGYSKLLLVHDDGVFLKESGLLERIKDSLSANKIDFKELTGILPNPRLTTVYEGIDLVKNNQLEFILAVGGGSVCDTAKAIGIGAKVDFDVWHFFEGKEVPMVTIPVGAVVTYPSAGSESSAVTVINNTEKGQKLLVSDSIVRPKYAFMNPKLTFSLPAHLTALGIVDMFSHICERYFSAEKEIGVIDRMAEGALKTIVELGPLALKEPENYEYRSELMWISTIAQNNTLGVGRTQDWATHEIGNELSALYDTAHGATISIIMPAWMKYVCEKRTDRLERFAKKVFDIDGTGKSASELAMAGIRSLEGFFQEMKMPITFVDYGVPTNEIDKLLEGIHFYGKDSSIGGYVRLNRQDCEAIYQLAAGK